MATEDPSRRAPIGARIRPPVAEQLRPSEAWTASDCELTDASCPAHPAAVRAEIAPSNQAPDRRLLCTFAMLPWCTCTPNPAWVFPSDRRGGSPGLARHGTY